MSQKLKALNATQLKYIQAKLNEETSLVCSAYEAKQKKPGNKLKTSEERFAYLVSGKMKTLVYDKKTMNTGWGSETRVDLHAIAMPGDTTEEEKEAYKKLIEDFRAKAHAVLTETFESLVFSNQPDITALMAEFKKKLEELK